MALLRATCVCGAVLKKDERDHYVYQCTVCVMREHEAVLAHHRGTHHPDLETLYSGPVEIHGVTRPKRRRGSL